MRILLTGGRGWIGSRLAPVLSDRGHGVMCVDREDGDLADVEVAGRIVHTRVPEVIVHLAAQPGRVFGEQDASYTVQSNVITTINVAQACAEVGARLCYVSTSEVYGDLGAGHRSYEDFALGHPLNLYAATKAMGEQVSRLYAPDGLLIIRPSMPFGPGMATGWGRAALPTMIDNFLRGEPFTVHAGTARSWCFIDDLVEAMADVIERGEHEIYNVGRDDDLMEMVSVAHVVCDVLGTDYNLIKIGEPDDTITPVKDISMARLKALGWQPKVSLREGIKMTADSLCS